MSYHRVLTPNVISCHISEPRSGKFIVCLLNVTKGCVQIEICHLKMQALVFWQSRQPAVSLRMVCLLSIDNLH